MKNKILLLIIFMLFLFSYVLFSDVCQNNVVDGDKDLWLEFPHMSDQYFRNMIASYFNLQKNDWDEGWGWAKYNNPDPYIYAFPKMMATGKLLFAGINDNLSLQGEWWVGRMWNMLDPSSDIHPVLKPLSRNKNSLDIIFKRQSGILRRIEFSQTNWYADCPAWNGNLTTNEYVSNLVDNDKEKFLIESEPEVLNRSANTIDVLGRGNTNDLFHYSWNSETGWQAENVTSLVVRPTPVYSMDRYLVNSQPIAISRNEDSIDVFALDNYKHLIHYFWTTYSGWSGEDITHVLGDDFRIVSDPVIYKRNYNTIDVVGRTSIGNLIHYKWVSGSGWISEDVTQITNSTMKVEGNVTMVSPEGQNLLVYARSGYKIIMYAWTSFTGWVEIDVTGNKFVIESDPVAVRRSINNINVFARDQNGHLINFFYSPGIGFDSEDVNEAPWLPNSFSIQGKFAVVSPNDNRVDIFARSLGYHLIHFYWTDELGWRCENIHNSGFRTDWTQIGTDPVAVQRGKSTLHVFAGNVNELWNGDHQLDDSEFEQFYSAIGLTVNPWHTNKEYYERASGSLNNFKYRPIYSDLSSSIWGSTYNENDISISCPSFFYSPALRAMVMIHEATHAVFWYLPHQDLGVCSSPCSDDWIFHGIKDPDGHLSSNNNNHSPYQLSIEYLCDLSEFANSYIPISALDYAKLIADQFMDTNIIDPPGWVCGRPRPLN